MKQITQKDKDNAAKALIACELLKKNIELMDRIGFINNEIAHQYQQIESEIDSMRRKLESVCATNL